MTRSVEDLARRWLKRHPSALAATEQRVLESAVERSPISRDTSHDYRANRTVGERLADAVAAFGGSWPFIIWFGVLMVLWTVGNAWLLGRQAFDPYPFIFLNLVLSMLAAIQAPIIMMSQNRQARRDRIDAAHDYEVNLKAEIEIMALHEKLDEMRHLELIGMRGDLARLAVRIEELAQRLSPPDDEGPAGPRDSG